MGDLRRVGVLPLRLERELDRERSADFFTERVRGRFRERIWPAVWRSVSFFVFRFVGSLLGTLVGTAARGISAVERICVSGFSTERKSLKKPPPIVISWRGRALSARNSRTSRSYGRAIAAESVIPMFIAIARRFI